MNFLYERPDGDLDVLFFDAVISESHEQQADVTTHPVESFTDHVRAQPARLTIEAHVTNTPIKSPGVDGASGETRSVKLQRQARKRRHGAFGGLPATEANYDDVTNEVSANVLQFSSDFDRVQTVESKLRELMAAGTEVAVITSLRSYEKLVISGVSTPRNAGQSNAATITINLVEIRVATTTSVDVPEPLETRAQRATSGGAQSPTEVPATQDESFLFAATRNTAESVGATGLF